MNREIKFRGKSKEDNSFVYGSYVHSDDSKNNPFRYEYKEKYQILTYFPGDWNMGGYEYVDVDPDTVGQYTGLKDKNGVEIYEGDVLEDKKGCVYGVVEWKARGFDLGVRYMDCYDNIVCEVIGNIYDNPELKERTK